MCPKDAMIVAHLPGTSCRAFMSRAVGTKRMDGSRLEVVATVRSGCCNPPAVGAFVTDCCKTYR